ncbi:N-hydroxyarylamine O-acetyltransferase [Bacillus sp. OV166]|uniref:arylamine N-acetyltransferase family protein n=1 Tax=Bacillus sp. OV166 TaxID=1882763 RepID=UPI000A2ABBFA|nr:arylamine N-acetyltransferase [Bacillus sp. OV166]SMQ81306.1 N-hydroxyarylamine O-acetyltransferase [Bacillus sp. OV166]
MQKLTSLFHNRIGMPMNQTITFEKLDEVLEKTAQNIPFENLTIIENKTRKITKENLLNKIVERNEGGLCFELNPLFYFYLLENGFNAVLTDGVVYNQAADEYHQFGRTHVTVLINNEGQTYLVDTGFGGNLPLKPVPISGETISSYNGEFRIKKVNHQYGDYCLEMKLKHKDTDWKMGYAFNSKKPIEDLADLSEIQRIIAEHPKSPFNKQPLITRLTHNGNITLTNTTFTQWADGILSKVTIDNVKFKELAKQHFGL